MHDFLSVDEVAGGLDFVEELRDVRVPDVEGVVGEGALAEGDYSAHSVDLCVHALVYDHVADFDFCTVLWNSYKVAQSRNFDFRVVFLQNADVVLDELSNKLNQM